MELAVLAAVFGLAYWAWKRPGRPRCRDVCEDLGKVSRNRRRGRTLPPPP